MPSITRSITNVSNTTPTRPSRSTSQDNALTPIKFKFEKIETLTSIAEKRGSLLENDLRRSISNPVLDSEEMECLEDNQPQPTLVNFREQLSQSCPSKLHCEKTSLVKPNLEILSFIQSSIHYLNSMFNNSPFKRTPHTITLSKTNLQKEYLLQLVKKTEYTAFNRQYPFLEIPAKNISNTELKNVCDTIAFDFGKILNQIANSIQQPSLEGINLTFGPDSSTSKWLEDVYEFEQTLAVDFDSQRVIDKFLNLKNSIATNVQNLTADNFDAKEFNAEEFIQNTTFAILENAINVFIINAHRVSPSEAPFYTDSQNSFSSQIESSASDHHSPVRTVEVEAAHSTNGSPLTENTQINQEIQAQNPFLPPEIQTLGLLNLEQQDHSELTTSTLPSNALSSTDEGIFAFELER